VLASSDRLPSLFPTAQEPADRRSRGRQRLCAAPSRPVSAGYSPATTTAGSQPTIMTGSRLCCRIACAIAEPRMIADRANVPALKIQRVRALIVIHLCYVKLV
jgi:hypothetical protein